MMHKKDARECPGCNYNALFHQVLLISIQDFDLEWHVRCSFDYLELVDVIDGLGEKLCGTKWAGYNYTSRGNVVNVVFYTDDYGARPGYSLNYEAIQPSDRGNICCIHLLINWVWVMYFVLAGLIFCFTPPPHTHT